MFLFGLGFGQNQSRIYNNKGQLIANTAYKISKKQLKRFIAIEGSLMYQIIHSAPSYPEVELDAGLEDSLMIVSFRIVHYSVKFQRVLTDYPIPYPGFKRSISKMMNQIELNANLDKLQIEGDTTTFYLAFNWKLLRNDAKTDSEGVYLKNGKIIIAKKPVLLIEYYTQQGKTINEDSGLYFDTTKCEKVSAIGKIDTSKVERSWEELSLANKELDEKSILGLVIDRKKGARLKDVEILVHAQSAIKNKKYDSTWTIENDSSGCFLFERKENLSLSITFIKQGYKCLQINGLILNDPYKREILRIKLQPQ